MRAGETIGTVELDDCTVRVAVFKDAEVSIEVSPRYDEDPSSSVYLAEDEATQLAELITKAVRLAPVIEEAADKRRRIETDAEAEYARIVADAIGGAA
ncbi:hypothetical protein PP556_14365 [Mycobacteroides abscessus]|nr:hypothetical protein [Mycobacteroides abscessus]MDM2451112.1 hypothetical protein [Mycobacteroides abscessus]MDM2455742.1 hypothetical protein [Mycobacteroides abscessus]MDM2460494.1 hypothetical protein [Mycobacteroides abscessus]MDM2466074.1 hypothetical protein [Mycobacteroides abscessus]